jgi:hypothetical protein
MAAIDNLGVQLIRPAGSGEQQQLFTPEQEPGAFRQARPGEQSPEQWMRRPDVWFHGTTSGIWESAPAVHYGSHAQALQASHGEDSRVHPRRFPDVPHDTVLGDMEANDLHGYVNYRAGTNSTAAVRSSMSPLADAITMGNIHRHPEYTDDAIDQWKEQQAAKSPLVSTGVLYKNEMEEGEDWADVATDASNGYRYRFNHSLLADPAAGRTWEQDKAEDPSTPPQTAGWLREHRGEAVAPSWRFGNPRDAWQMDFLDAATIHRSQTGDDEPENSWRRAAPVRYQDHRRRVR